MNALVRKLERFAPLGRDDIAVIERLCAGAAHHRADEWVGGDGESIPVLLSGFAYRFKLLSDGRRQIHGLFVAGDLCRHVYGFLAPHTAQGLRTLAPSTVAMIPGQALVDLMGERPRIARALWVNTLLDDSILREWVVSLGRRTAYERMAHLFCEMFLRLDAVGLTDGDGCELPLTQVDLGDLMGLSTVHVNRVLQQLRRDEVIGLKGSRLTVRDIAVLRQAADLDPAYLHLIRPGAAAEHGPAGQADAA